MIISTVAIGTHYETLAQRLQDSFSQDVIVITEQEQISQDPLINGLWHKSNFANFLTSEDEDSPVLFCDADMFSLTPNPLETFEVNPETDIAFVPYKGNWHFPDKIRQEAFNHFGYKINSGFIWFKNLQIAKQVCSAWVNAYLDRIALYETAPNITKNEYDEYALMIALKDMDLTIQLLDSKWNVWGLTTKEEIQNSDSIFFQSHDEFDL